MNYSAQDPGTTAFVAAVEWLEATLLGSLATSIAVIAVAAIGFLLLTGRIQTRPAARVVIGCFIIFGAARISAGIMEIAARSSGPQEGFSRPTARYPVVLVVTRASASDPYAGAALPDGH